MNLLFPLEIGLIQGLLMSGAVLSFALAFRLFGFPDLTVEASVPLSGATYAILVHQGLPPIIAVVIGGAVGAAAGATTAALHVRFNVNKFLAGIIVISIAYSVSLRLMAGPNVSLLQAPSLLTLPRSLFGGESQRGVLLVLAISVAAVCCGLIIFLGRTTGTKLRAAGSNPRFAESIGIHHNITMVFALAGCNAVAALSGAIQADYQGFADVASGQGVLILALAALAMGEALVPRRSLRFHQFVVLAGVVGSICYHSIIAFAVRAGLAPTDLRLATGMLVLVVVALRSMSSDEAPLEEVR